MTKDIELKEEMAQAHRLWAKWNLDELTWNHISCRSNVKADRFFITPGTKFFSQIEAGDIVMDTNTLNVTGNIIHDACYQARPDVNCVVHLHPTACIAVGVLNEKMRFTDQSGGPMYDRIAYYDWEGVSTDWDEQQKLRTAFLNKPDCLIFMMKNHGVCAFGKSLGEAMFYMYYIEKCCRTYLQALSAAGGDSSKIHFADEKLLERDRDGSFDMPHFQPGVADWPAMKSWIETQDVTDKSLNLKKIDLGLRLEENRL